MRNDPGGAAAGGYSLSAGRKTYIFVLLFLLYFFDVVDRYIVSSMFPFIREEWGLSDTQSGLLIATVYWSIVIFIFPASILVDRWSRRKTISLMAILWSCASIACMFANNFNDLFMARTFLGIGEAGYAAGGTAIIAGLYPMEKRGRYMGIWNASIPLATAVGITLGGFIAAKMGWRSAFGLTAAPGLVVAVMFYFIQDYKTVDLVKTSRVGDAKPAVVAMRFTDAAREFLATPTLLFTYFGFAGVQFATNGLITWLPTYFHRVHDITTEQAGLRSGLIMLLAIVGAPLGGIISDIWVKKRPDSRLKFAAITTGMSAVLSFAAFMVLDGVPQYVALIFMGVTIIAFAPAAAATTQEVIHPGLRAISYALNMIVANLLGGSLGPLGIGLISDARGIQAAMGVIPVSLSIAALLFFTGSFYFMKDYDKAEKVQLQCEK
jgi:MFS family permease